MGTFLYVLFLVAAGLGSFAIGLMMMLRRRRLKRKGSTTNGMIVRVDKDTSGTGESQVTAYYPVFQFSTPDGKTHVVRASSGTTRSKAYRVGQAVEVLYLPGEEQKALLKSFFGMWLGPIVLACMGLVLLSAAIVLGRG